MSFKSKFLISFLLLVFTFFSEAGFAEDSKHISDDPIFEIIDRFGEVRLGLTGSSVYIIVSEDIKDLANTELQYQQKLDMHSFEDSEGNFIPLRSNILSSNKLEFSLEDISSVEFKNAKIEFTHSNSSSLTFSDIHATNGNNILENFYLEDLEAFYIAYKALGDSKKGR
ncbi:MAG: hypothetical protein MI700_01640 [Balneolales bacterium]|nr:hypothetical protein [Balneolales bacterium]